MYGQWVTYLLLLSQYVKPTDEEFFHLYDFIH